jgi:hypothetical protein
MRVVSVALNLSCALNEMVKAANKLDEFSPMLHVATAALL